MDGVSNRLDKLNENLERSNATDGLFDDEVNYDMHKLKSSNIELNRKMLSQIAIVDPSTFEKLQQEI